MIFSSDPAPLAEAEEPPCLSTSIISSSARRERGAGGGDRLSLLRLRLNRFDGFLGTFLSLLGLRLRGGDAGDLVLERLRRLRLGGLALRLLGGGLPLRLRAYPRPGGGDLDRLGERERDLGGGERRRLRAGGLLSLLLPYLRSRGGGGVKEGERNLRRWGGGERDMDRLGGERRGGGDLCRVVGTAGSDERGGCGFLSREGERR